MKRKWAWNEWTSKESRRMVGGCEKESGKGFSLTEDAPSQEGLSLPMDHVLHLCRRSDFANCSYFLE